MSTMHMSSYLYWTLTPQEEQAGRLLNVYQKQNLQNLLTAKVEQFVVTPLTDEHKNQAIILQAQIELLKQLLDDSALVEQAMQNLNQPQTR